MTETYTAPPSAADIDDDPDTVSADLDRQADAILQSGEARSFDRTSSIRQSLRDDAGAARAWGRTRAERVREAVREEPIHAALYALGIGVLIGLLAAR